MNNAFTVGSGIPAQNNACYQFMYLRGPYDNADPISKVIIGDVRRMNDGLLADKVMVNLYKTQAAFEALRGAGVVDPYVALAKDIADTDATVFNEVDGNFFPWSMYNRLGANKQVPWGSSNVSSTSVYPASTSTLAQTGVDTSMGMGMGVGAGTIGNRQVVQTFNNGTALARGGIDSTNTLGPDLMLDSNDVVPGLSLFSVPDGFGSITTLQPSGAAYIQSLGAGDVITAVKNAGYAQAVSGFQPTTEAAAISGAENTSVVLPNRVMTYAPAGGPVPYDPNVTPSFVPGILPAGGPGSHYIPGILPPGGSHYIPGILPAGGSHYIPGILPAGTPGYPPSGAPGYPPSGAPSQNTNITPTSTSSGTLQATSGLAAVGGYQMPQQMPQQNLSRAAVAQSRWPSVGQTVPSYMVQTPSSVGRQSCSSAYSF